MVYLENIDYDVRSCVHGIMSNQRVDCYVDSCTSSTIKISLLQLHVGLFTQNISQSAFVKIT